VHGAARAGVTSALFRAWLAPPIGASVGGLLAVAACLLVSTTSGMLIFGCTTAAAAA